MTEPFASRRWDAVVVGGGHNGLTAAAYLARAGRSVLVLERRDQVGGACTLEQPFADARFVVSPCAYLVGLLHPLVIEELDLAALRATAPSWCDPTQWTPVRGRHLAHPVARPGPHREARSRSSSPADVDGFVAYEALFDRIRTALRLGARDTWVGDAPTAPRARGAPRRRPRGA